MFTELLEAFQFSFFQRALIAGTFIAISCAFLGVFLVLRKFSMIGDGLAHFALATIGLGLLVEVSPFYVSIPLVMLASLGILYLSRRTAAYGDAAIGMFSTVGVALGILLVSLSGGINVDLFGFLFGDILAVSRAEVWMAVGLSAVVMTLIVSLYYDLFVVTFDENYAQALGIRTDWVNRILVLLTALTVVLGIKVVGVMLVSSLILFPAMTALQMASSFKTSIAYSLVVGVCSVVGGIIISYLMNLPAGACIVLFNAVLFVITFVATQFCKS